jgi:predicted dinucleotide-utilizing enzyme
MPQFRFLRAYLRARDEIRVAEAAERRVTIEAATRKEIKDLFNALPEKRQAEMVGAVLSQSDMTDTMLRRFVQTCPQDKHIEVSFLNGATVIISGSAGEKRGPGW